MDDLITDVEVVSNVHPETGRRYHYPDEYVRDGKHYVMRDGTECMVLRNGALRNKAGFIKGSKADSMITTSEQGKMMQKISIERKRAVVVAAANEAVENENYKIQHGDMAYVAAIANAAMMKATTVDDPKAIEAARFVLKQSGILEGEEEERKRRDEWGGEREGKGMG